jgi:hypothetical protein
MSETKKCAHAACSCQVSGSQKYCSTKCESAKHVTELTCQCGHSSCQGEVLKT